MKNFYRLAIIASVALTVALTGVSALAQGGQGGFGGGGGGFGGGGPGGGGGFNMANMLQNRVDAMRPDLSVTNDDEWNIISPRLLKVMQLQAEVRLAGIGGMLRGGRNGGGGGGGRAGGLAAMLGTTPDPSGEALDTAVNNNAPVADLKAAMAAVRDARKKKQAEMMKAQADLKEVISVRQEAYLLSNGILD